MHHNESIAEKTQFKSLIHASLGATNDSATTIMNSSLGLTEKSYKETSLLARVSLAARDRRPRSLK